MNIEIISVGGFGPYFGADRPKQFVVMLGKPILTYTIEIFEKHLEKDAIKVVYFKL